MGKGYPRKPRTGVPTNADDFTVWTTFLRNAKEKRVSALLLVRMVSVASGLALEAVTSMVLQASSKGLPHMFIDSVPCYILVIMSLMHPLLHHSCATTVLLVGPKHITLEPATDLQS